MPALSVRPDGVLPGRQTIGMIRGTSMTGNPTERSGTATAPPSARPAPAARRIASRVAAGAALATALAGVCGCGPDPREKQPANLLLISIDTLRADHLGVYGYSRPTSPNIDAFAAQALVFERAYTHAASTAPAMASIMTSKYPHHHGVIETYQFALGEEEETLAERLGAAGMRTAAILGIGTLNAIRNLDQGFDSYSVPDWQAFRRPATEITDDALAWLATEGDGPFFLWAHYFEPHQPYDTVPDRHLNQFSDQPLPPTIEPGDRAVGAARRNVIDKYDGAISFVDEQVGRLLAGVSAQGLLANTMIILTADHGEELLERGRHTHGHSVYQEQVHVPLLIYSPGVSPGRVSTVVRHVDLLPTVLRKFDLGQDPTLDGRRLPLDGSRVPPADALAQTWRKGRGKSATVVRGPWKFISSDPGFERELRELYDLSRDPRERTNLVAEQPEKASALERRLNELTTDYTTKPEFIGIPENERAMLRSLGYIE